MESSFSTNHQSSGKVEESRDWKELPRDVMVTVLVKLSHTEILESVQFVCKSWHDTCKDPALWKKLHFSYPVEPSTTKEAYQKMAFNAIDRSCGSLVEICFELYGNDPLLLHMAQLSSKLRCLRIEDCDEISNSGLCEAIEKLPLLQEIEISHQAVSDSTIRYIGQYCPNLVSFKLNDIYTDDSSDGIVIAETMPGIHHLQLIGSMINNTGLLAILDSCSSLESLHIKDCFNVDLSGDLAKRCADIMLKDGGRPHIWIEDTRGGGNEYDDRGDESEDDEYYRLFNKADRDYHYDYNYDYEYEHDYHHDFDSNYYDYGY